MRPIPLVMTIALAVCLACGGSVSEEEILAPPTVFTGVQQGFYETVMKPNIAASERTSLVKPENWDQDFYNHVATSFHTYIKSWNFFRKIEEKRKDYWWVTQQLRDNQLPEVIAAIPYQESRYDPFITSIACARGYWQLMPEWAPRLQKSGVDFVVKGCKFKDRPDYSYTPVELASPSSSWKDAEYILDGHCRIPQEPDACIRDDRTHLQKSTKVAIATLLQVWKDEEIRKSGAAVQMTILTHNAGYNDAQYGEKYHHSYNILPSYQGWMKSKTADDAPYFYGKNITCKNSRGGKEDCVGTSVLFPETQHYAHTVVAQHLLAVCYYAKNYPEEAVTQPWQKFVGEDGYCEEFKIPSPEQIPKAPKK